MMEFKNKIENKLLCFGYGLLGKITRYFLKKILVK